MSETGNNNLETGLEIAVIGMSGRFPGAKTIDRFWDNLKDGVESVTFFSEGELAAAGIDLELLRNPGYVKARGLLADGGSFDADFFNYTPREAEVMDPQLRIFHQCAWHALEDAGYNPDTYGSAIGLYAGNAPNHSWFAQLFMNRKIAPGNQFEASLLNEHFSTLVSYRLNLHGPALTIRTACSTSLVAIHMACVGLLSGECDMALAGGVSLLSPQEAGYLFQEGMIYSSDGHCRTFDVRASGSVFGNGVGVVVLKRLADARADRDFIHAVIKGSAINNDGIRKVGYTAPSVEGQAEVIRAAYMMSGVEPGSIGYLEAHGTATPLGDPVEIEALKMAFNIDKKGFCAIGSVKTNVGHLNAAAGVAGFIKTVLALKHRQIPISLNFEIPNPKIHLENSPFYVNTGLSPWKDDSYPLRAGVSSFGLGGTNAHVVLEESPMQEPVLVKNPGQGASYENNDSTGTIKTRNYQLILVSAKTLAALEKQWENLCQYLKKNSGINLADVAYTCHIGRKHFQSRKMAVCPTGVKEAVAVLSQKSGERGFQKVLKRKENPSAVFVFSGQGFQYADMGLELYMEEPVFRTEIDRCSGILKQVLDFDIKDILYPGNRFSDDSRIPGAEKSGVIQAMVFTFEYALAKLLMKWGIKPRAMMGYSLGEYIAACLSGVFSLEEALKLIAMRGRIIDETPVGAMLSVPLDEDRLKPLLMTKKDLSLAIVNGPSCIISGSVEAIKAFEQEMKEKRLLCTRINISRAIHSKMMEAIKEKFVKKVSTIPLNKPRVPYISNVSGDWISEEEAVNPGYWGDHLCSTVRFSDGINTLLGEEDYIFIEIGPGRVLSNIIRQVALTSTPGVKQNRQLEVNTVINMVRHQQENVPDQYFLLSKIGQLWAYGMEIDWAGFYAGEKRHRMPLPLYPFAGKEYFMGKGSFNYELGQYYRQGAEVEESGEVIVPGDGESGNPDSREDYEAPRSELEQRISGVWTEVLGYREISIHDNFFDLNGDSLTATQLISRIQQMYPVDISLESFFHEPTIAQLAGVVKQALIERIKLLSPEEKKKLAGQV